MKRGSGHFTRAKGCFTKERVLAAAIRLIREITQTPRPKSGTQPLDSDDETTVLLTKRVESSLFHILWIF